MKRLLVILDGAAEEPQPWPTSLEEASLPVLDRLCRRGAVRRLVTTPAGLQPGSETGIPTLLGCPPRAPVGRGWVEAAAARFAPGPGTTPWRLDVRRADGERTVAAEARAVHEQLVRALPRHCVAYLRGHRYLAIGAEEPKIDRADALRITVWPDGEPPSGQLSGTAVICGPGAAAGCGRLLGADVYVPRGATGDVDSDLRAKVVAATRALEALDLVVVHLGGADEAAHRRDPTAKRAFLEAADRLVIAPLAQRAGRARAHLAVTSDHSTCPYTGRHGARPVPLVVGGPGIERCGPDRLSEHALEDAELTCSPWSDLQVAA